MQLANTDRLVISRSVIVKQFNIQLGRSIALTHMVFLIQQIELRFAFQFCSNRDLSAFATESALILKWRRRASLLFLAAEPCVL